MNRTTWIKIRVKSSDLAINVLLLGCIVVKLELYKCVAPIAGKETNEIMCPEDLPLLRGVVLYTLIVISAEVAIDGKSTYKRSNKCVKMKT